MAIRASRGLAYASPMRRIITLITALYAEIIRVLCGLKVRGGVLPSHLQHRLGFVWGALWNRPAAVQPYSLPCLRRVQLHTLRAQMRGVTVGSLACPQCFP